MIDRSAFYLEPIPVRYAAVTLYYVAAGANIHISDISVQIDVFMNIRQCDRCTLMDSDILFVGHSHGHY